MEPHPDLTAQYAADTAKPRFLMDLFDRGARHDARAERTISLGLVDVATGTGLVARAATDLGLSPRDLAGLAPSVGMPREAGQPVPFRAEYLPACP